MISKLTYMWKKTIAAALLLTAVMTALAQEIEVYAPEGSATTVQLRTNGLYWLALSPNIGVELQTDMGVTFSLDYVGAWWNKNQKHRYFSNYAFQLDARYYLNSRTQGTPYLGHHVGIYGQMMTYDFEFGGTGYQSNDLSKTWTIGAAYGYRLPLGKRFAVDFTIGIGYLSSKYDVYKPYMGQYVRTNTKRLKFYGPTRLETSFVWNINATNN